MPEESHYFFLRMSYPWVAVHGQRRHAHVRRAVLRPVVEGAKSYTPTMTLFALCSIVGLWLQRYVEIYPSIYAAGSAEGAGGTTAGAAAATRAAFSAPFGLYEVVVTLGFLGLWGLCYLAFMNAFPRSARVHADIALPRRGPGTGRPEDDGAAASTRMSKQRAISKPDPLGCSLARETSRGFCLS
jgi:hypothetical protein